MKEKVMNGLEKFSKAMLSPLSYISAAGLILALRFELPDQITVIGGLHSFNMFACHFNRIFPLRINPVEFARQRNRTVIFCLCPTQNQRSEEHTSELQSHA